MLTKLESYRNYISLIDIFELYLLILSPANPNPDSDPEYDINKFGD
jgi:hypothetical protein